MNTMSPYNTDFFTLLVATEYRRVSSTLISAAPVDVGEHIWSRRAPLFEWQVRVSSAAYTNSHATPITPRRHAVGGHVVTS